MTTMRTRILGGASLAGFAVAAMLALAPATQAESGAFGDGSVRSIKQSIPSTTWTAMVTHAGGEVVSDL
jgi:hypothetical protein